MNLPKIARCPWCRGRATATTALRLWWVWCDKTDACGAAGPQRKTARAAILAWNHVAEAVKR